jgi:hypothetical protein
VAAAFDNRVRSQRLVVEAGSPELAMALRSRLGDLNRRALLPVIEAVLAELAPPGRQVRIPSLQLDLGEIDASALEDELPRRLAGELRRAVADALRGGEARPAPGVAWRGEAAARTELLERLLAHGTVPFWAPPSARSLEGMVVEMAGADPDGLAGTVRRLGRRTGVLHRLAAQLGDPALAAVVRALEPVHATLVLAYVRDLRRVHRAAPLVALSARRFGRLLWVLAHAYLVRDPGSQFNRRSFVRSLLRGMARDQGVDYAALLATLAEGLARTRRHRPAGSSLPAVVAALLHDQERDRSARVAGGAGAAEHSPGEEDAEGGWRAPGAEAARALARYDRVDALGYLLRHGVLPWSAILHDPRVDEAAVAAAITDLPRPLLESVLDAGEPGERRRLLARLARFLPEDALARLLLRLIPWAEQPETPFREALRGFAAAAADRRAFLARVVGAALDGGELDLEALATDPPEDGAADARPADLAAWPPHLLRSVLTRALRPRAGRHDDAHPPAELLAALAASHPADARHYLRTLGEDGDLAASLARQVPEPLHARLIELLDPAAVKTVDAVHAALAALPSPERRFSGDELRQVLLVETMRLGEGEAPGEGFFSRVLARLLGPRLPGAAGGRLLASTEGWVYPAGVPAAQVEAFRAAVAATSGGSEVARAAGLAADPPHPHPRPRPGSAALRAAVFAYLLGEGAADGGAEAEAPVGALSADSLQHALRRMVDEEPREVYPFFRRHSADARVRDRWVRVLPEPALARLSQLLGPRHHAALLDTAETLAAAWTEAAPAGHPAVAGRAAFWGFLLEFLARNASADRLAERLVLAFFADRALRCRGLSPVPDLVKTGAALMDSARRLAHGRGNARLRGILHRRADRLLAAWSPAASLTDIMALDDGPARGGRTTGRTPASPPGPRRPMAQRKPARGGDRPGRGRRRGNGGGDEPHGGGEPIYVPNAGLVLAGAFIPHLFQSLGLLDEDEEGRQRMKDAEAVSRGVHLLQYLVDGRTDTEEPLLVLNKLLCGVPIETPVERSIDPTDAERQMCDRLLAAILAAWPAMDHTSVEGLRETFLRREGRLDRSDSGWRLTVQRKTVDVLMDQVPWSLSVVFHRWMPEPVHVTW